MMWPFKKKCDHQWKVIAVQTWEADYGPREFTQIIYRCTVCDEQTERWPLGDLTLKQAEFIYPKPLGNSTGKPF